MIMTDYICGCFVLFLGHHQIKNHSKIGIKQINPKTKIKEKLDQLMNMKQQCGNVCVYVCMCVYLISQIFTSG